MLTLLNDVDGDSSMFCVDDYFLGNGVLSFTYDNKCYTYKCTIFDLMCAYVSGVIHLSKLDLVHCSKKTGGLV